MGKGTKKVAAVLDLAPVSLGELIHASVRRAIETAVMKSCKRRSARVPTSGRRSVAATATGRSSAR